MKINNPQQIIDNNKCTLFMKMKKCVFIFAVFKNAIDWKIIESPLNDKIPVTTATDVESLKTERVFAPRVTSKIPYNNPWIYFVSSLRKLKTGKRKDFKRLKNFNVS